MSEEFWKRYYAALQKLRGNNVSGGGGATIEVINSLTSSSTTDALSAAMGKELKRQIDEVSPSGGGTTTYSLKATKNNGQTASKSFNGSAEVWLKYSDLLSSAQIAAVDSGITSQLVSEFENALEVMLTELTLTGAVTGQNTGTSLATTLANSVVGWSNLTSALQSIIEHIVCDFNIDDGFTYEDVAQFASVYKVLVLSDLNGNKYVYSGKDGRERLLFTRTDGEKVYLLTLDTQDTWDSYETTIGGGGTGGTTDYSQLDNKPSINNVILTGNRTFAQLGLATVASSGSYNDLTNKPTIPTQVTSSTVSSWGFTKNTGTVTGVKMNGSTYAPVGGSVNLGTVITEHQPLTAYRMASAQDAIDATKASKATNPVAGHIATLDHQGNPVDSGIIPNDLRDVIYGRAYIRTLYEYQIIARQLGGSMAHFIIQKISDGCPKTTDTIYLNTPQELQNPIPVIKEAMLSASVPLLEQSDIVSESANSLIFTQLDDATFEAIDVPTSIFQVLINKSSRESTIINQFRDTDDNIITPQEGKLYVDVSTNRVYRYNAITATFIPVGGGSIDCSYLFDKDKYPSSGYCVVDMPEYTLEEFVGQLANGAKPYVLHSYGGYAFKQDVIFSHGPEMPSPHADVLQLIRVYYDDNADYSVRMFVFLKKIDGVWKALLEPEP